MRPLFLAFLIGCGVELSDAVVEPIEGPLQPLTQTAFTTLQGIWAPNVPSDATAGRIEEGSFLVTDLDRYESEGLGVHFDPGIDWIERAELGPGFSEGPTRKSVLYIWQGADPQIIDEESPIRFEGFDGLYRPNGHLTPHTWEAHLATAQRISDLSGRPFEFAIIAGDLTDGSQANELGWFLRSLVGGGLDPDSGADDDVVEGPGNDYNDPFWANGLQIPWYAAIGNHETTYNGGFGNVTEELRAASVGSKVYEYPAFTNGYRDGATLHADVVLEGSTPPDDQRLVLYRKEVLAALRRAGGTPEGHGLTHDDVDAERGYFSVHPIEGKPIRLVVLDTVHTYGLVGEASMGFVSAEQLAWLRATLAEADAAHELVLVMSHHRLQDLSPTSEASTEDVAAALASSEGVLMLVTGHGHSNTEGIFPSDWDGADPTEGFWQLMLASTVDFPMQSRVIEVVDEGNGYVSVYCTNLDHNSPPDSMPHLARAQAAGKWAFPGIVDDPNVEGDWAGQVDSTNYLLRIKIPDAISAELGKHTWADRIESEQTLAGFETPTF